MLCPPINNVHCAIPEFCSVPPPTLFQPILAMPSHHRRPVSAPYSPGLYTLTHTSHKLHRRSCCWRFHWLCQLSQSSSASDIVCLASGPKTEDRVLPPTAPKLLWLWCAAVAGVAVGRVWYSMSGSAAGAGAARTLVPVRKQMRVRRYGLCVFIVTAAS